MQDITQDASVQRGPLLPAQIIIYALIAAGTLASLWPVVSAPWRKGAPIQQSGAGSAQATDGHAALADEVQGAAERWQKDGFTWTLHDTPAGTYDEVFPVDMRGLESADFSRYRKAATQGWQGVESLPTLAGAYSLKRLASSPWPHPGSAALELMPAMAPDPDKPAKPWRVVLLFAATKDATTYARQAVANASSNLGEQINMGRAALTTLAVPIARQTVNGLETYYCICPTAATLQIGSVKLSQAVQQNVSPGDAAAKRYAAWKSRYDSFVATVRERDHTATTTEQHQQIKADVLAWKTANPEPPQPPGSETNSPAATTND